jgi:hypothetical protein
LVFWGNFWRRGAHVNTLEIGSRGGEKCLGEFRGVYADLRRDFVWGNSDLDFLEVLAVVPRRCIEEGGQLVLLRVLLG